MRPKASISANAGPEYANVNIPAGRNTTTGQRQFYSDKFVGYPRGATLNLSQTIFDGGRTSNSVRQAESSMLAARAGLRQTEQTLLQNVVAAYMNMLRDMAIAGLRQSNVKVLDDKFGDSGVAVQFGLIQNALQAYPDMNVIWGCAPAAEAAIGAVAQAGKKDVLIMSSYENQAMLDALNKGEILGFATQYPVLQGRIAIDTAVRILEKKEYVKSAKAIPDMIAKSNLDKINMGLVLAPANFNAVYSVKAP